MEETIALIKSCIISKQGGIPIGSLNHEFEHIVGESIPYERLGFPSLENLLREVDGLKTVRNVYGEPVLTVNDSKIKHIADLIKLQKQEYNGSKSKYYKRFAPYTRTFYNNNNNDNNETRSRRYKDRNQVSYSENRKWNRNQRSNRTINSSSSGSTRYTNNKHSYYEDYEENNNVVIIETGTSKVERIVYEPIFLGHQLIGDDFFLQLVIRNLGLPVWRPTGDMALRCGLCVSGQTINDCITRLNNVQCISNRVVVMLGAVDIYNGASIDDLTKDMKRLLKLLKQKFYLSNSAVTICTIPPLANLSVHGHGDKIKALYTFNDWIRCLMHVSSNSFGSTDSYGNDACYRVIDLCESFMDETLATRYDYFQLNARMVSGCKHPYVLWNKQGRKHAMEMLTNEL